MKWMTREKVEVDQVPCRWLIKTFVDRAAELGGKFRVQSWTQPELTERGRDLNRLGKKGQREG